METLSSLTVEKSQVFISINSAPSGPQPIEVIQQCLQNEKVATNQVNYLVEYAQRKAERVKANENLSNALQALGVPNDENIQTAINMKKYNFFLNKIAPEKMGGNENMRKFVALNCKETCVPKNAGIVSRGERNSSLMFIAEGTVSAEDERG